jgi:hypothetical protein
MADHLLVCVAPSAADDGSCICSEAPRGGGLCRVAGILRTVGLAFAKTPLVGEDLTGIALERDWSWNGSASAAQCSCTPIRGE